MKNFLRSLTVATLFLTALAPAWADPIDNTSCTVLSSNDDENQFNTLRRKVDYYNRTNNRLCTEQINFYPNVYDIFAEDTYVIDMPTDTDFDGNGWNLIINGYWSDVEIDGTGLDHDQCVFEVWNDHVRIRNITIRVWDKNYAICNHGVENDFSLVTIIETKPKLRRYIPFPGLQPK